MSAATASTASGASFLGHRRRSVGARRRRSSRAVNVGARPGNHRTLSGGGDRRDADADRGETNNEAGNQRPGGVYLVGAGPGGLDNLTVRALRLLRSCDVVVYDDLGAADIVDEAAGAELIYVGKRGGKEGSWVQADIDALLVRLCADGKRVVRLKGGCPSVFSRAHSEIAALADAGWCAELVPGISSALAAPLAAGITLTDRDLGRHFSVASAHDPDGLDFDAFRGIDTCVFLMVGRSLARVAAALTTDAGKGEDVPVAVIRWGCTPREEVYRGTLGTIAGVTAGRELSPCVMVVGEVAAMGRETR